VAGFRVLSSQTAKTARRKWLPDSG
jgi:hypothetical protein